MFLIRIESRFCIVGSPSHEYIISAFYHEGAGLVAVCNVGSRNSEIFKTNCLISVYLQLRLSTLDKWQLRVLIHKDDRYLLINCLL